MKQLGDQEFSRISQIARDEAGLHLPLGKRVFVSARLQRRLRATGAADFTKYVSFIESRTPTAEKERACLVSALTTNVTGIFREPHHFRLLFDRLSQIEAKKIDGLDSLRIWCAGCSSGEEALSIAATCATAFGASWTKKARILATDVDTYVLRRAMDTLQDETHWQQLIDGVQDSLPTNEKADLYRPSALREGITFMRHNLLAPLPARHPFDVIFCRNVTIYFAPDIQTIVHHQLQQSLAPEGLLMIGHSERLQVPMPGINLIGATTYIKSELTSGGTQTWH